MRNIVTELLKPILAAGVAILIAHCGSGCKDPYVPSPGDTYAAEQSACVVAAATEADACECRKAVDWKYGLCTVDVDRLPGPSCFTNCDNLRQDGGK